MAGGCALGFYLGAEIVERQTQAVWQIDLRLPSKQLTSFRDVRTPLLGIVLRQREMFDSAFGIRHAQHLARTFENCKLPWITDVRGILLARPCQLQDALDFIAHIAEA